MGVNYFIFEILYHTPLHIATIKSSCPLKSHEFLPGHDGVEHIQKAGGGKACRQPELFQQFFSCSRALRRAGKAFCIHIGLGDTLFCVRRVTVFKGSSRPAQRPYRALLIGLNTPERALLYARIDARVDAMLARGLLDEARLVYARRDACRTAAQAIGYKEFFPYFEGREPLEACTATLKQASRNYAKRQLTWFRRMDGLVWLPAGEPETAGKIARLWAEHVKKDCGSQE